MPDLIVIHRKATERLSLGIYRGGYPAVAAALLVMLTVALAPTREGPIATVATIVMGAVLVLSAIRGLYCKVIVSSDGQVAVINQFRHHSLPAGSIRNVSLAHINGQYRGLKLWIAPTNMGIVAQALGEREAQQFIDAIRPWTSPAPNAPNSCA